LRAVATVTGPVGLPDTYSTWIRCGAATAPAPYRGPRSSTRPTACRYQDGVTRRLRKPGPATSTESMYSDSSPAAIRPAMSRGAERSGFASWSAIAVA
jgi:hypothetical protein